VLQAATEMLVAWFGPRFPGAQVAEGIDALVRLVVSHLVLPAEDPSLTPDRLARLALTFLTSSP
jgi:hypothetical protein